MRKPSSSKEDIEVAQQLMTKAAIYCHPRPAVFLESPAEINPMCNGMEASLQSAPGADLAVRSWLASTITTGTNYILVFHNRTVDNINPLMSVSAVKQLAAEINKSHLFDYPRNATNEDDEVRQEKREATRKTRRMRKLELFLVRYITLIHGTSCPTTLKTIGYESVFYNDFYLNGEVEKNERFNVLFPSSCSHIALKIKMKNVFVAVFALVALFAVVSAVPFADPDAEAYADPYAFADPYAYPAADPYPQDREGCPRCCLRKPQLCKIRCPARCLD
ncbi:unnamed protein product [Notodromas monacha]|uniref:Uncharacterized protein n=1 Tax=Notodromas monacha TaxID=399045 RepID=A0A7R9BQD8_9CRUS|nr:unnamed protein product [Notodromas monacha]CAG0918886.1 unnamed protein product [Notodromas monacha]